jgi:penicillin-binding protein 1C
LRAETEAAADAGDTRTDKARPEAAAAGPFLVSLRRSLPKEWWRQAALAVLCVLLPLMALDAIFPPPMERAKTVSAVVLDSRGAALRIFPVDDGKWRMKADLDRTDPAFIRALLAYEDSRYFSHGGVDPLAIVRALSSMVSAGRIVSGGSTITMQTARLLEPRPRTLGAKIIESIRAIQLERRFSKKEILELYLTLAPYGGNLEGVRAASFAYFGREPDRLSPDQIALLIALPQSPEARRPDLRPDAAISARRRVLMRLASKGVVEPDLARESAAYPAPGRRDFPALAWHAAEEARTLAKAPGDVRTTLDMSLQKETEDLSRRAAGPAAEGVQVAILIVDIASREVRAAVGSSNRSSAGGWIDLTNRPRSPGSTLKPFIYGIAFDDGAASASTRISDAPQSFASYRPDNFDRTFRGDVTVAQALQHSLNVPAVSALDEVGARRFAAALTNAGADLSLPLDAEDDAGLAIALGGAGLTVRELATLYAALGDAGRAMPLVWLKPETKRPAAPAPTSRIMSAESAREILDILKAAPTPDGRMPATLTTGAPVIAFKTGTSYGFRDAWAAGVGQGHAVIVWMGRADGAPRPGITGREAALPVLFDAFDTLERIAPSAGDAMSERLVDAPSEAAPDPLKEFGAARRPPQILFPPDKAEVWSDEDHRTFVLAAEGSGRLTWYADGTPIALNAAGEAQWRPTTPGYYTITVVDEHGLSAASSVRIRSPER